MMAWAPGPPPSIRALVAPVPLQAGQTRGGANADSTDRALSVAASIRLATTEIGPICTVHPGLEPSLDGRAVKVARPDTDLSRRIRSDTPCAIA